MREPTILAYDDMVLAQTGDKIVADEEAYFGWGKKWYLIDLTSDNYKELEEFILPYVKAATEVAGPPAAKKKRAPYNNSMRRERTDFFRDFRAWMETQGRLEECRAPSGSWSHPSAAVREYEKVTGIAEPKKG